MSETETLRLNCPKCEAAVRVPASSAGRRVRCPRCQADFKVPGAAPPPPADDDDWLNLDQPLPPPVKPASGPAIGSGPAPTTPPVSVPNTPLPFTPATPPGETESDDFFAVGLPPLPSSSGGIHNTGSANSRAGGEFSALEWDALQSVLGPGDDDEATASAPAPRAKAIDEPPVSDFRVTCPICGSITYARPDQVGKQLKCHDCYSAITVPPPPKPKKVYRPDMENAPVYGMSDSGELPPHYNAPGRKSADEYLREAEAADAGAGDDYNYENPDIKNWLGGIFRIFLDPQVAVHWLLLSIFGSLLGAVTVFLSHPAILLPLVGMTLFYWAFVFSCGFSVMEAVSNNAKRVEGWPYMDPTEWFGQMVVVVSAAALCMGPPAMLGMMVLGLHPVTVMACMFALFLLFPFVLMSMLDSESIFVPFSAEVTKSVTRCQEQWGVLYLSSGLLFFGMFIFYIVCFMMPPLVAVILVYFTTVAALFIYFSMLGRLAYAIGHAVNAPPASDQVDRQRRGSL